jgi:hypothetical protein
MDALERLRARIADFPGYDGEHNRRLADEFVRSYLGEALANVLAERSQLSPDLQSRLDALLLQLGFADPKSFATHHVIEGLVKPGEEDEVATQDAATVELADRARSVDPSALPGLLDEVARTLDLRQAAMRAAAAPPKTS